MAKRFLRLAFFALAAASAEALAQPATAPVALPRSPPVNIRLSPDLGDALPAIQSALRSMPNAQVAEPADYELTTKRNYPQTLVAIDAREEKKDWDTDFSEDGDPRLAPRTFELGNLVLGDYGGGLQTLIDRAGRAKKLLALQASGGGVESCVGWVQVQDFNTIPTCHFPDEHIADARSEQDMSQFAVRVHNGSTKPRYVALLTVEPSLGVQRLELLGKPAVLAPGAVAQTGIVELLDSRSERVSIVTISSDRPIDPAVFLQPALEQGRELGCENDAQDCSRAPVPVDTSGWSVSVAENHVEREVIGQMGGGASVVEGMAPWMTEYYSTVPYTKAEIAADALKPTQEREFLAERSSSERAHRCGGSLIAANLVLTAAHCVAKGHYAGVGMARVMAERRVRIGTVYLGDGGTTYAVAGVAVPASYSPDRQDNDIALLLIKPDRDTNPAKTPTISVGIRPLSGGVSLTGFGWGYTGEVAAGANTLLSVSGELQHNPDELQFGVMRALDQTRCERKLGAKYANGMVCLVAPGAENGGRPEHNVFSCRGDSGGPLVRRIGKKEELVGLTSWSMGCGHNEFPSVYTDVTKFVQWIAAARQELKPGGAIFVDDPAKRARHMAKR
jgi:hypothetical protein